MAPPSLPSGRDVNAQEVNPELLSSPYDWPTHPEITSNFRELVELSPNPRTDMARIKLIDSINTRKAKTVFSEMCNSKTKFRIPEPVRCDRTFARDVEEVYYLSAMDVYLNEAPADLDIVDLPILKTRLQDRLCSQFSRRKGFFTEHYQRRRVKLWLPHDFPENEAFSDAELSAFFPKVTGFETTVKQPPAMPVPFPYSGIYYHKEIRDAQRSCNIVNPERHRRLLYAFEREHYILMLASWWNEAFFGGRMFVLEQDTIGILAIHCSTIPDICGKPAQVLIELMRSAAARPDWCHNWLCFKDFCMEESSFIWAVQEAGHYDPERRPRQTLWCSRSSRHITTSRYTSTIYKGGSTMDKRLKDPDLDQVEGLLPLVRERGWDEHGSLRVRDLAHYLFNLYRYTNSRLGETLRHLDAKNRDLHESDFRLRDTQDRLSGAEYHIHCKQRDLDDMVRRLHDSEQRLHDSQRRLHDSERRLEDTRRALQDANGRLNENRRSEAQPLRSGGPTGDSRQPLQVTQSDDGNNTDTRNDGQGRANAFSERNAPAPPSGSPSTALPSGGDDSSAKTPGHKPLIPKAMSPFVAPQLASASSPAQARAKSPFQPNFSKYSAGNLPWTVSKVAGKRSHDTMSGNAGDSQGNRSEGRSGTENVSHPRAGNEAKVAKLSSRHRSTTAYQIRARQQEEDSES